MSPQTSRQARFVHRGLAMLAACLLLSAIVVPEQVWAGPSQQPSAARTRLPFTMFRPPT